MENVSVARCISNLGKRADQRAAAKKNDYRAHEGGPEGEFGGNRGSDGL
jgi:hypothetical protein